MDKRIERVLLTEDIQVTSKYPHHYHQGNATYNYNEISHPINLKKLRIPGIGENVDQLQVIH